MSLAIDLYRHLKDDADVNSLVGGRISPITTMKIEKPYITYMIVNNKNVTSLGGDNYQNVARLQLDIFSSSYSEVQAILVAVKKAMYNFKYQVHDFTSRDLYEDDTKLFRQLIDFKLITKE